MDAHIDLRSIGRRKLSKTVILLSSLIIISARYIFFEIFRRVILYIGITTGRDRGGCRQGPLFNMLNADVVGIHEAHAPVPFPRQVLPLPSRKRILFT